MSILATRISLRNDSIANWLANQQVVLLKGEVGIEFSENSSTRLKIGDGHTAWENLPYFSSCLNENLIDKRIFNLQENNVLSILGYEEASIGATPIKGENGQIIWIENKTEQISQELIKLTEIVNEKVSKAYSEVDGEQIPWTLLSPEDKTKLDTIELKAQENKIEAICLPNSARPLAIVNKTVQIPFANNNMAGLVKLSKEIGLDENQSLSIRQVNVNKLAQTKGEEIHLLCGDASL